MDCLKNNLKNSQILHYDIMNLIYEYADPLIAIRKQIDNKNYDLNEIMYKRMKQYIKWYILHEIPREPYYLSDNIVSINSIDAEFLRVYITDKYKREFLYKSRRPPTICGLDPHLNYAGGKRTKMAEDCSFVNSKKNIYKCPNKYLYKKWLKL